MNVDILKGQWKQIKGGIKEKWGKLTDDDLEMIAGRREELAGRLQKIYGQSKDEVERQIDDFEKTYSK